MLKVRARPTSTRVMSILRTALAVRRLPGPPMWALPAMALRGLRRPHELAVELHERFGDVVRLGSGPFAYVYLFGEEGNRLVLFERPDSFTWREAFRALEPVNGPTSLVLSDGDDHHRRRRLVQPAFATRRIDSAVPTIVAEVDRAIDALPVGRQVDLYVKYRQAVRRIVVRVLFGDALAGHADELGEVLEPAMRFVDRPPQFQLPGSLGWVAARRARRAADHIVDAEIARRRSSDHVGSDALGILLSSDLSDVELRDQVVSLIAAGYETTTAAVAWTALELLRSPGEWERCRNEVVAQLGDGTRSPTADDLREMPYVTAAVNETLRLWPPAVLSGRRSSEALNHAGYVIPAGATVLFSPFVTHRSTALWGEDADRFRPSRWLESEPSPSAFIPFGGPHRRCIGFALALTEIQVAVVRLVQRTSLTLVDAPQPRGIGLSALRPEHGVHVLVDAVR